MKLYELVIMLVVLGGCIGMIGWFLIDMHKQLKAFEERCESLEEDEK